MEHIEKNDNDDIECSGIKAGLAGKLSFREGSEASQSEHSTLHTSTLHTSTLFILKS